MDECDVVVPRTMLGDFMAFVDTLEKDHGVRIRSFGHAGDGNLHIYLCKDDLKDAVWNQKCDTIMGELYTTSSKMGGQISGEHGIGHAKHAYLCGSLGCEIMGLMRGIKRTFDPNNILNPGKIV